MLKYLFIFYCIALLPFEARAQTDFVTTYSFSKQFVVYGPKAPPVQRGNKVSLDSPVLAVSCERIKQTLLNELEGASKWQMSRQNEKAGKIYVVIHRGKRTPVLITPIQNSQSLSYRIDLPAEIESAHLIEAVTQATLLELANRNAQDNFTQIPRWLAHGLAARVQSSAPDTLVLKQNLPISSTKQRVDPNAKIREELQRFDPLTFEELSWADDLSRERSQHFDSCAQLFVNELFRLKKGDDCLRQFLDELPKHLNWQVAFLRAFQPHFKSLVDVEKWWGLRLVNLTGRDAAQRWSGEQSLTQIERALRVPVQTYSENALPNRNEMTLQEIISAWEIERQKPVLTKISNQLKVLRTRVQPELAQILDRYSTTLDTYLKAAENDGLFQRAFSRGGYAEARQTARTQLDSLDQQRATLKKPKALGTREDAILSALEVSGQRTQK